MNNDYETPFSAEEIDEQLDFARQRLRSKPASAMPIPDLRLIEDMQRAYPADDEEMARALERVRQRLAQRAPEISESQPGQRRGRASRPGQEYSLESVPPRMPPAGRQRRGFPAIAALAAAVVLVAVIGSLVVGLILVRQHSPVVSNQPTTQPGQTVAPGQTPTATPAPKPASIYGIVNGNTLVALNAADGTVRWQYAFNPDGYPRFYVSSTNVYIQDPAYSVLTAINEQDGSQRWQKTNAAFLEAANGLVFISSSYGATLSALAESDGSPRWTFQPQHGAIHGVIPSETMILSDDTAYLITSDSGYTNDGNPHNFLYALNIADGQQRWLIQSQFSFEYMTLAGDTLYLSPAPNSQGDLGAFNVSDGTERWHTSVVGVTQFLPPTVVDGVVYVPMDGYIQDGGGPAFIYAYSASDGKLLWHSEQAQANVAYSPVAVDHGVVYATDQENVYAFNATNGQQLWRQQVGYMYDPPTPVVENGLVYVNWYSGKNFSNQEVQTSALNEANGQQVWTFAWPTLSGVPPVAAGPGSPTVLNGVAYLYLFSTTAVVDARTGNQLWQQDGLETIGIITDS